MEFPVARRKTANSLHARHAIHLVLRLGSHIVPLTEAIVAHQAILGERGRVMIAKVGRRIGVESAERLNSQIASGVETFVFLACGHRARGIEGYRCKLESVTWSLDKSYGECIPEYYKTKGVVKMGSVWFRVSTMEPCALAQQNLIVVSSASPIIDALRTSSSGAYMVREDKKAA